MFRKFPTPDGATLPCNLPDAERQTLHLVGKRIDCAGSPDGFHHYQHFTDTQDRCKFCPSTAPRSQRQAEHEAIAEAGGYGGLSAMQKAVLRAVAMAPRNDTVTVRRFLDGIRGEQVNIGDFYAQFETLRDNGYLLVRKGTEPIAARGDRPRIHLSLTDKGLAAIGGQGGQQ